MPPLTSKQIEVGAKATVGGVLLTAALFQIDKALQYYDLSNLDAVRFVQDGRQVHRGIEFTAFGKLTDNLTLTGGITLLDAKVKEQKQTPAIEGNQPQGVAEKMAKMRAEYRLPFHPALSLTGSVSYVSHQFVDAPNTDRLPGFTLYDIGARYQLDVGEHPLTLRLDINNVTGKAYWSQEGSLGDPRTVLFSISTQF
jgi:iron complex outermembrane receptor protein